jgi:lipopolysaccharide export system permease protein
VVGQTRQPLAIWQRHTAQAFTRDGAYLKTVRRLVYREVLTAIALVAAGFLALFFFFDLVDELQDVGKSLGLPGVSQPYEIRHALLFVTLLIPNHLYELLPISVLIGTIFVMARFAQSSEYTILRTSGLGPWRALRLLLTVGAVFVVLSFVVGDYLAPASARAAQLVKARFQGDLTLGQTGAWLKEKQSGSAYIVNVKTLSPNNTMTNVKVYEFDSQGLVTAVMQASSATFAQDGYWSLNNASRDEFSVNTTSPQQASGTVPTKATSAIKRSQLAELRWQTDITQEMVSVALRKPERMGTLDLFNYVRHLDMNGQTAQRYEIELWRKVFYPLSCLVMVILALPFAYLHFRAGGISTYVFAGVMIGISFFLLNNVFGYIGNLQNWTPWLAAATPGLLYALASLGAFGWLVLRR